MDLASSLRSTGYAQVIVVLKRELTSRARAEHRAATILKKHFTQTEESQDGALLAALRRSKKKFSVAAAAGRTSAASVSAASLPKFQSPLEFPNLGVILGTVDREGLQELRQENSVDRVVSAPQLQLITPVISGPARLNKGYTWGLRALGIDHMHAEGLTGRNVVIAHLDTGVDASHPALNGTILHYAEFDSIGNLIQGARPKDSDIHGTHTAGTLVGQPVRGVHFGVAPGARLASAMVIEGGNVIARILGGMDWAIAQGARILSMSLGFPGYEESFSALVRLLRARGVLPVFAVGNEGAGTSRYPGNYGEALSVGAATAALSVADFSGSQLFKRKRSPQVPDLVGPGVDIVSCVPSGKYEVMSGTSMAVPHVAGLCALLMEAKPSATIKQVEDALFRSCVGGVGLTKSRANRGLPSGIIALREIDTD